MATERNTAQRRAILDGLARTAGFISARDLHAAVVREGTAVSLATVYAQLRRLAATSQVDVVMTERGESLFRRCATDGHHHHLSCRECGATVDIDAPLLERFTAELGERTGYDNLSHVLELTGRCPACRAP
ncbi:MAG: Fur family transcriptional regulator [Acidimicrobiales bacterium]